MCEFYFRMKINFLITSLKLVEGKIESFIHHQIIAYIGLAPAYVIGQIPEKKSIKSYVLCKNDRYIKPSIAVLKKSILFDGCLLGDHK